MPAKKHIAVVMDGLHSNTSLSQQGIRVPTSGTPKRIKDHAESSFVNGREVDDFTEPLQIDRLGIELLCRSFLRASAGDRVSCVNFRFDFLGYFRQRGRTVWRGEFDPVVLRRIVRSGEIN